MGPSSSAQNNIMGTLGSNKIDQQDPSSHELRIVLVGSAGAGKSATGNSILGEKHFESRASARTVTLECQREVCVRAGRSLVVVDTPGFLNKKTYKGQVKECLKRCGPGGPPTIVLVLQTGRFTQEEREAVKTIKSLFGKKTQKHMVVVFTRKDDLGETSIKNFVKESEPTLRKLIAECGGRFCAVNNRATGEENTRQVEELMRMINEAEGAFKKNKIKDAMM
ncbi:GTPase IMAP family member 3-like [Lissotriton helveticus]